MGHTELKVVVSAVQPDRDWDGVSCGGDKPGDLVLTTFISVNSAENGINFEMGKKL